MIIAIILMYKGFTINLIYDDLVENGISTIGVTNPARNIEYYSNIYIMPWEHYISFVAFGATSGFIFHQYI